jgi:hypothetical protein
MGLPTYDELVAESDKRQRQRMETELRSGMLTEAAKSFGLINGGGAVALGSLLQALWPNPMLTYWKGMLLLGIGWMAAGVVFSAIQPVLRYFTSMDPRSYKFRGSPWWWWHMAAVVASVLCFVIGCALAVAGGRWSLG